MKAYPLIRAWLAKHSIQRVQFRRNLRWIDGDELASAFYTPDETKILYTNVIILALIGASWPILGSDGTWTSWFADKDILLAPFTSCNVAYDNNWSKHMNAQFGKPLNSVAILPRTARYAVKL